MFPHACLLLLLASSARSARKRRYTARTRPTDALLSKAHAAMRAGQLDESSLDLFGQVLARDPLNALVHGHRGNAMFALRIRPDEALAALDAAIRIDPLMWELHEWRAMGLLHHGARGDALASLERSLAINPASAVNHDRRAILKLQAGHNVEEVLAGLELAVQLDPLYAPAHDHYGSMRARGGVPPREVSTPTHAHTRTCARVYAATSSHSRTHARTYRHNPHARHPSPAVPRVRAAPNRTTIGRLSPRRFVRSTSRSPSTR